MYQLMKGVDPPIDAIIITQYVWPKWLHLGKQGCMSIKVGAYPCKRKT
jgi:hypothetical protein